MVLPDEVSKKVYQLVEIASKSGKVRKGSNEATKCLERSRAKAVVVAADVNPKEIIMHFPILAKETGAIYLEVPQKAQLGASCGLKSATSAVAIEELGEGSRLFSEIQKDIENLSKKQENPTPTQ